MDERSASKPQQNLWVFSQPKEHRTPTIYTIPCPSGRPTQRVLSMRGTPRQTRYSKTSRT